MIQLPGGTFLMGTADSAGFPLDGEGPVRKVTLNPFRIDPNEDFAQFVDATGFRTEAEKFGWSFVFWSHLPEHLVEDDGYAGTCPVDAFPPNGFGVYSITGNVWEWCADWFSADFHQTASHIDPQGPPTGNARVMKSGSFLCHKSYCNRYRVAARTSQTPDSSTSNIGFRCAL